MSYKLSDQVSMRLIQIFQEAVITGVDGADLLRQVKVSVDPTNETQLVLDADYVKQVDEHHAKLLDDVKNRKNLTQTTNLSS